jgi:hypothetical protein
LWHQVIAYKKSVDYLGYVVLAHRNARFDRKYIFFLLFCNKEKKIARQ